MMKSTIYASWNDGMLSLHDRRRPHDLLLRAPFAFCYTRRDEDVSKGKKEDYTPYLPHQEVLTEFLPAAYYTKEVPNSGFSNLFAAMEAAKQQNCLQTPVISVRETFFAHTGDVYLVVQNAADGILLTLFQHPVQNNIENLFTPAQKCEANTENMASEPITESVQRGATEQSSRADQMKTGKCELKSHENAENTVCSRYSEFALTLPFNFMGTKNGGGWENQYLLNTPYEAKTSENRYLYLSKVNGAGLEILFLSPADGWKMDYSPFACAHYMRALRLNASFDRIYGTGTERTFLQVLLTDVENSAECLQKLAAIKQTSALWCEPCGGMLGQTLQMTLFGEADILRICDKSGEREEKLTFSDKKHTANGRHFTFLLQNEGDVILTPFFNGQPGAEARLYAYQSIQSLWKKSMDTVSEEDLAQTDGNLCEHQCWAAAMLRYMMLYGKNEEYEAKVKKLLGVVTESNQKSATKRRTILPIPHNGRPAYHIFESDRMQEQAFGVTLLLDSYLYFKDPFYLDYATRSMDTLLAVYQAANGSLMREKTDYSTVCSPMIPLVDLANALKSIDPEKSRSYFISATALAEHLFHRGMHFPTEGCVSHLCEEEMEEGSIACTALSLLYYCAKVQRRSEYIDLARRILRVHDAYVMAAPVAQINGSTVRFWETLWEGDADGPALCVGHGWTIWRAEADYLMYVLTGNNDRLSLAEKGYLSNFSKIRPDGRSYAIYQVDKIPGGGFHNSTAEVAFRLTEDFPRQTDSGLSRYVWLRRYEMEK